MLESLGRRFGESGFIWGIPLSLRKSPQIINLCMTELEEILARLGLSQYLGRLIEEGFEKWETVLDITEQDL